MGDDKTNRGAGDRQRINTSEDYEIAYWTEQLGCTREELLSAVVKVGNMADDVRNELRDES